MPPPRLLFTDRLLLYIQLFVIFDTYAIEIYVIGFFYVTYNTGVFKLFFPCLLSAFLTPFYRFLIQTPFCYIQYNFFDTYQNPFPFVVY